jgi:hypothetical protein
MCSGDITGIAWAPRTIPNGKEIPVNYEINNLLLEITDSRSLRCFYLFLA